MLDLSKTSPSAATDSDYQWSLGHCSSSLEWKGPGTYIENCCLPRGTHILNCKTRESLNDWSRNVVMIMGHRFCDDFVGYEALIELDVSGAFIYIIHIESMV